MDFMDQLEDLDRPVVEKKEWMNHCVMELVNDETLDAVIDMCIASGLYALDLETTGLDNRVFFEGGVGRTVDSIVGYCLSPDGVHGYYIPVRHVDTRGNLLDANISAAKVAIAMRRLVDSPAIAIFHNGKFDHEFLQYGEGDPIGEWDNNAQWEDTLILAYLRNTRERNKGLKALSFSELGKEMIELPDLFPEKERKKKDLNFSKLDPTWPPCIWYAASDAICTYLLFKGQEKIRAGGREQPGFPGLHAQVMNPEPHGISQNTVYKLEKMCLPATRWMERSRINIDRDKIEELIRLGHGEWFEALGEVYAEASRILGRDITPGYYRLMAGTADIDNPLLYKFVPDQLSPTYMDQVKETRKASLQRALDPMEVGPNGKNRIRTVVKDVPSLANVKKRENINFPAVYDVTIPAQLGLLLRELGVQGLQATAASGQVKTSKDVLDEVIERAGMKFPFMGKIKRFRETAKALGTNLFPIWLDTSPSRAPDGCIRVNFNAHKVDTGRFATPKPSQPEFHGTVRWNLHSIPATYDKNKPACMLRIRECVAARPGRIMAAIDYSGVELRIVTNISREPLWLAEFFRCSDCKKTFDQGDGTSTPPCPPPFCPDCGSDKIGDLHTLTAMAVYGDNVVNTPEFKGKRQKSKSLNFAMCYGGGAMAAQRAVGVDKDEGWRIKRQFDAAYTGLKAWWEQQHRFARKYKYVVTAFNRRYPLPDIDSENGFWRSKAERNSVNGPVQGCSADITKLAMGLVYKAIKKKGWLRRVYMTITIHDELVFEIDEEIAEEAIELIVDVMTRNKPILKMKFPIPLKVDTEVGHDWTVPYNLTELKWNQSKKPWTPWLISTFPKAYLHYLSLGGAPIEGVETPEVPDDDPDDNGGGSGNGGEPTTRTPFEKPDVKPGQPFVHVIHSKKLAWGLLDRLAQLILKCENGGTSPLRVETERGEPLWDGEVLVNPTEFLILAREYRL